MEKQFADGFYFSRRDNAPAFVVGTIGVSVDNAVEWLKTAPKNEKGFINLSILQKRDDSSKYYIELDTYEPRNNSSSTSTRAPEPQNSADLPDDLPF